MKRRSLALRPLWIVDPGIGRRLRGAGGEEAEVLQQGQGALREGAVHGGKARVQKRHPDRPEVRRRLLHAGHGGDAHGEPPRRLRELHRRPLSWTRSTSRPTWSWDGSSWGPGWWTRPRRRSILVLKEEPKNEEALLLQSAIYLAKQDPARAQSHPGGAHRAGDDQPGRLPDAGHRLEAGRG